MRAAIEAYDRLMAARRFVSDAERADDKKETARLSLQLRIRRKLPKVL